MKKITLEALAKQIGVGIATVDRVINERGGVSPATTRRVLAAAREAGLNRLLPDAHRHPWQVELLLSSNEAFFFGQLSEHFSQLADQIGYRSLTLHRTLVAEGDPQRLAAQILRASEQRDGLMIFAHEHPAVLAALARCRERGVPVITLATDLPGACRLCHVGIDQLQAGRTAGLLMGKMLSGPGEVVIISGRMDYLAHRQRVEGFSAVITSQFPQLRLHQVLTAMDDRREIGRQLEAQLYQSPTIRGIYNTGLGNTDIGEALARHRLADVVFITHELYPTTRRLLAQNVVALTLDQNTREHAQRALTLMLNRLEQDAQPDEYQDGKVEFLLYTRENCQQ
ncbi:MULTISPECIES: LacI family DNA-binding transcriptional regulator [unclassified Erwinia]|uniref:LacI family DNA-binding transcriptional regulator n=1 Tax=unclassified Erwinia TaxID=2622719 RepID=UPI0006F75584|nr:MULTISPECIES: LacI family DNA-binding transcriptional regulator [unclassified Erwinia]KQN53472.1 transcriptional regulator [Erwinia sp. Leaf53]PLV61877.1 transcriptional regulator [Erwinia sp. B116]